MKQYDTDGKKSRFHRRITMISIKICQILFVWQKLCKFFFISFYGFESFMGVITLNAYKAFIVLNLSE